VTSARAGDQIIVMPGTYSEPDTIVLNKPVTILGGRGNSDRASPAGGAAAQQTQLYSPTSFQVTAALLGSTGSGGGGAGGGGAAGGINLVERTPPAPPAPQVKITCARCRLLSCELSSSFDRCAAPF
jgi:hypothetical protein